MVLLTFVCKIVTEAFQYYYTY